MALARLVLIKVPVLLSLRRWYIRCRLRIGPKCADVKAPAKHRAYEKRWTSISSAVYSNLLSVTASMVRMCLANDFDIWIGRRRLVQVMIMTCKQVATPFYYRNGIPNSIRLHQLYDPSAPDSQTRAPVASHRAQMPPSSVNKWLIYFLNTIYFALRGVLYIVCPGLQHRRQPVFQVSFAHIAVFVSLRNGTGSCSVFHAIFRNFSPPFLILAY